eukprot:5591214-Prymnesium_polylepis.2
MLLWTTVCQGCVCVTRLGTRHVAGYQFNTRDQSQYRAVCEIDRITDLEASALLHISQTSNLGRARSHPAAGLPAAPDERAPNLTKAVFVQATPGALD